jgi:hypothetical protein
LPPPLGKSSATPPWSPRPTDLESPVVIDGKDYGAPLENLKAAMHDAGLESVDLWIGSTGVALAQKVIPVIHPKAYLPVNWDGLFGTFEAGVPKPFADAPMEKLFADEGVALIRPRQYGDKWRLDRSGVKPVPKTAVQRALGF